MTNFLYGNDHELLSIFFLVKAICFYFFGLQIKHEKLIFMLIKMQLWQKK